MIETNKFTREFSTMLVPQAALIAYRSQDGNQCFLELRKIGEDGKMSEGRPVTYEFMNELTRNYSGMQGGTPFGVIPKNLLYCDTRKGSEKYIWYNPPRRRMMYFRECLKIENAEYNLPGVIYVAKESALDIYAYKGGIPDEKTELFEAPFFNVTRSSVCLGSARIEKPDNPTYDCLLEYWEKRFWLTEFTHLGGNGNPTKSNLVLVTKAAQNAPFNPDELKPLKITLKNILQ